MCVVLLLNSSFSNFNNLKILERLVILKKIEKPRQTFMNINIVVKHCYTKQLCDGKPTSETNKIFKE